MKKSFLFVFTAVLFSHAANSQFLMDMVDTSKALGNGILNMYNNYRYVRIGGYLQTQFQMASAKGISSYAGGNFEANSRDRFMIRRGRIRLDYVRYRETGDPFMHFVFQFDGTERGVYIRDLWGRLYENKFGLFSFTTGMFARPFSYELNTSSADRESPERGRMSQILTKTERDLGAMVTFEPKRAGSKLSHFKWDLGLFNGQGLTGPGEFDSHKDLITRLALKPVQLRPKIFLSMGASLLDGGMVQNNQYMYSMSETGGNKEFRLDSSLTNVGKIAPRKYYGADIQLKFATGAGFTELRFETVQGMQTATKNSTETPGTLLQFQGGYFKRNFRGCYAYFLTNIFSPRHQLVVKYDVYDPNTDVSGEEINASPSNLTAADIRYATLGFGYNFYMNPNFKLVLYYDHVKNESTLLPGYIDNVSDDVFTCRLQYRF